MSVTDLVADALTVIRNAINAKKKTVTIKRSSTIEGIIEIAKKERFIENYRVLEDDKQGSIKVYLKYLDNGESLIKNLERISKPGRRYYIPKDKIKPVIGGIGISVISTNKGLLTDKEAKELGLGGELICRIW